MIFSSYISMATKPIAFNEGAIEFLTGYLIGIGELQVNPDPVNWTEPSIMLFSEPLYLVFISPTSRTLKHISFMSGMPLEIKSAPSSPGLIPYCSVTVFQKNWIKFLIGQWACTLAYCTSIDPDYEVYEEFPELFDAFQILKS